MIVGCGGAGKSTLSRELHKLTGIEIIHLDQHYWKAGWVESDHEQWIEKKMELLNRDSWIMDGNFSSTMELRIVRSDFIIFLDYSTWQCLKGVIGRVYKYRGKNRSDLPEGCPEKWDWQFLHYVLMFRWKSRPKVLRKLKKVEGQKEIKVFQNRDEAAYFIESLRL